MAILVRILPLYRSLIKTIEGTLKYARGAELFVDEQKGVLGF